MSPFPKQPYNPDLIAIAALATTSYGRSLLTAASNITVIGSFTKAQLDTAVSDDNVAYLGQANTFVGNQAVTGNITTSGTGTFSGTGVNNFRGLIAGHLTQSNTPGTGFIQDGNGYGIVRINTALGLCFDTFSTGYNQVLALGTDKSATFSGNITATGTGTFAKLAATPVTFAGLPSASANTGLSVQVSDRDYAIATSNGTNWLRAGTSTVLT